MGEYYSASVCLNGHVITSYYENEEEETPFCTKCGAKTIAACPNCGAQIRGAFTDPMIIGGIAEPPKYCHQCGAAYPWTQSAIDAAVELAEEDDAITASDIEALEKSLPDVMADTPRTKLASVRVRKVLEKAGEVVGSAIRDILVDVASETAKKVIFSG